VPDDNTSTHVRDYAAAIWRHRLIAAIAVAATVVPVVVFLLLIRPPLYESTAAIMVRPLNRKPELFRQQAAADKPDVDTEVEIMKSPPVTAKAASLMETAGLDPTRWLKKVEWNRIEDTVVVHITAFAPDPELARDLTNALGDGYLDYCRNTSLDSSRTSLVWLERQVGHAKIRMQHDRQALQEFCAKHPQITMTESTDFDREYYTALLKEQASVELAAAQAEVELQDYAALLAKCGIPRPDDDDDTALPVKVAADDDAFAQLAALSQSNRLGAIVAELDVARATLAEKQKHLKERHPEIVLLRQQIATLEGTCREIFLTETQNGRNARIARLSAMRSILAQKKKELDDYRDRLLKTSNDRMEYALLVGNIEAGKTLYNTVIEKLKQYDISQGLSDEVARFIQRAPIGTVSNPYIAVKIIFALLCGLFIGVGLAILVDYLDTTIKTESDVEQSLGLPVLALVPAVDDQQPVALDQDDPDLMVALQ